jgi:glutamine synthetase
MMKRVMENTRRVKILMTSEQSEMVRCGKMDAYIQLPFSRCGLAVQILCDLHNDDGAARFSKAPRRSQIRNMKLETMVVDTF